MDTPLRSLRVAMVAPPYLTVPPQRYGGTELVIAELCDGLLAWGAQVTLFAAPGSRGGFEHRCETLSALPAPVWPPTERAEWAHCEAALATVRAQGRFHLVHAHAPAAVALSRALPVPMVATVHHDPVAALSARYLQNSQVTYAFVSSRQRSLEVALPRSEVVHHGLSPSRYPLGDGARGHAAFLGRFSESKGLHRAIDAAGLAQVPLRAAGQPHPADRAYFERTVAPRLGRSGVELLGEADHSQKLALLQGARALLFPITWNEPFGLVMVESMLCGTPVIAFRWGAAPELIDSGVTGFLVGSVAEMAQVLRALADGMPFDRERCRGRAVARFAQGTMVARYLQLYARTLRSQADAPAAAGRHG